MRSTFVGAGLLLFAGVGAACGSSDEATDATAAEQASGEPVIEVTFDGTGCTADGPTTVSAGDHMFLLVDESGEGRQLDVRHLAEGRPYEELVGMQEDAGGPGTGFQRPAWVENTPMPSPQSSPAEGRTEYTHSIESGTYALVIGTRDNV